MIFPIKDKYKIGLTQGQEALLDQGDYKKFSKYKWHATKNGKNYYAARRVDSKIVYLHRELLGLKRSDKRLVDHINRDSLDNRMGNLRIVGMSTNVRNREKRIGTTSKHKGVSWSKRDKKWRAYITINGKTISLGYYNNEDQAAKVYSDKLEKIMSYV